MPDTPDRVAELLAWWEREGRELRVIVPLTLDQEERLYALAKLGAAAIAWAEAEVQDESLNDICRKFRAYTATRQEICNAK